jgi:TolA-binding protein
MKRVWIIFIACAGFLVPFQPSPLLGAVKIKEERLKEIVSGIMKENGTPLSESERSEALKEYQLFLSDFNIASPEEAESLEKLGHMIMAMEENGKEGFEGQKDPVRHYRDHTFSIALYEKIRASGQKFPFSDELLYQLAHGYAEMNREDKALERLRELIARFPKSRYYAESLYRIGETDYAEGKYPEANQSYLKAMGANPGSPLIDYITYKLIWSDFKMGEYSKSIDLILNALGRYSVRQKNGNPVLDIEMMSDSSWKQVKELLHLATLSFDFLGGAEKVRGYFEYHGHVGYENLIYRPLGHLYLNRGRFREAAVTFKTFLALYPNHEDAPQFQLDLIDAYEKSENREGAREAKAELIENFKPESAWWKSNNRGSQEKTALLRKELLYQMAQDLHGNAQKSGKKEDYLDALAQYQKFITNFPNELEAPRIQYYIGEAYFETGQFEQAAAAYESAAYHYPPHANSEDSGFAALISYEKAIRSNGTASESLRLPLLKSCQLFVTTFPDSSRKARVLYKAFSLSLQNGNLPEARNYANQIYRIPAGPEEVSLINQTRYSLAKYYFENRDYATSEEEFRETLKGIPQNNDHPAAGPSKKEIESFLASIQYRRADALRNQLKWNEAGAAYFHLYEELPGHELAPVALMNAGSAYLEGKDLDSALRAFSALAEHYPKSPYFIEAEAARTSLFERKNDWNQAAEGYETLVALTPEAEKKNRYLDNLYSIYYKKGDWSKLYQALPDRLKEHSDYTGKWLYYYAESAKELNKEAEILRAVETGLRLLKEKKRAVPDEEMWIMKAVLLKGDYLYRQFVSTELTPPLDKSLPLKKERLRTTLETFTLAAESGNPEIASEALYHIGNLFEQFASDVSRSERPKELTDEQKEIYEGLLKNQVAPLYQKAIETYQKNLAFSSKIDNDWIRRSEARYRQLILENKGTSS